MYVAQAATLPEQLLAPVKQRADDHAGTGDDRGLDPPGRLGGERQGRDAVDRALADHLPSCPSYGPRPVMQAAPQRAPSSSAADRSQPAASPWVTPPANESPAP